jgi:hypothetical protein
MASHIVANFLRIAPDSQVERAQVTVPEHNIGRRPARLMICLTSFTLD